MERFAVLEFEDLPDVRVRISPVPFGQFNAIYDLYLAAEEFRTPDRVGPMVDAFAPFLDSWEYPEPATREGLDAREVPFLCAVVREWIQGVRRVPRPLPRRSFDGEPSEDPTTSPEPSSALASSTQ